MSQIEGKFDIVTTELRLFCRILSQQTFTRFLICRTKKLQHTCSKQGGGGQRFFEQCSKKRFWFGGASLMREYEIRDPSNSIAYPWLGAMGPGQPQHMFIWDAGVSHTYSISKWAGDLLVRLLPMIIMLWFTGMGIVVGEFRAINQAAAPLMFGSKVLPVPSQVLHISKPTFSPFFPAHIFYISRLH